MQTRAAGAETASKARLVANLAARQHGVVSRRQLLRLGISEEALDWRLRDGALHLLHPGIYAVGHPAISRHGWWTAAVLAAGPGAVLSHRSAAALWKLIAEARQSQAISSGRRRDRIAEVALGGEPRAVEVTAPRSTRSHSWLHRHCAYLPADEITVEAGIPVTTVSRTLIDLAAVVPPGEFERALREAEFLRLPEQPPLEQLLARYPRRRGRCTVREVLEHLSRLPGGVTRSSFEDRFLLQLHRAGLPAPTTNTVLRLGGHVHQVDCLWAAQRLIVELDGHQAHGTRTAFESDRARDRRLQAAGWRVIRVTWRQMAEPTALIADLRHLLTRPLPDESVFTPGSTRAHAES